MAWTTSADLCARLGVWDFTVAQMKSARFAAARLRRSLSRCHPNFAFAAPLAALGFITPLLPTSLTATVLLAAGATLAFLTVRSAQQVETPAPAARKHGRIVMQADSASGIRLGGTHPAFHSSQIAFEREAQRAASPATAATRARLAPEHRDRSWAELMARVNHDLRTPLNAVMGFSEVMALELFGPLGDERYQDYVHHIRDSATDLLKSAEDTLALTALMTRPNRREDICACDLELLANDAWTFVSRKAAARAIDLDLCVPADMEVVGESRAMRQVLVNMLSEGIARAGHGERVILTAIADGELVELSLSVSRQRPQPTRKSGSLAICLARTLLEMQGTSLLEFDNSATGWSAVTVLDRVAQPDFFHDRVRAEPQESMALMG